MKCRDYIKVVYRRDHNGIFVRRIGDTVRTFWQDFCFMPLNVGDVFLDPATSNSYCIDRIHFHINDCEALCWFDKHGNLIVRYMSNNKQLKIDF